MSFNPNTLVKPGCGSQRIQAIFRTELLPPLAPLSPSLVLDYPNSPVSLCQETEIIIFRVFNDGGRGLSQITWSITSGNSNSQIDSLLSKANLGGDKFFTIPRLVLSEFTNYDFQLTFKNFLGSSGIQQFRISSGTYFGIKMVL